MLDAYIIDAIREAELERERAFDRRRIQLEITIDRPPLERPKAPVTPVHEMGDPIVISIVPEQDPSEDAA